jgi:phage host-nuclease inhibitor protein Gam
MGNAKKKLKAPALTYPAPQNREEADEFIFKLGQLQRDRIDLETAMNEALAAAKLEHENLGKPLAEEIAALMASLQTYCEAHREELCPGKLKTVKFGNGEISWRSRPPKVTLRGGIEKIIAWCKTHGLALFVRTIEQVNKEAMLDYPDRAMKVPGVSIASAGEDFIVKPLQSELEEVL